MKFILLLPLLFLNLTASAQVQSQNPTYFKEVGQMIGEIRGIKWYAEICNESVPETAVKNSKAYDAWLERHRALVDEIEGQFSVIEAYWQSQPPKLRAGAINRDQFNAMLNAEREIFRQNFLAQGKPRIQSNCNALIVQLTSKKYDLAVTRAEKITVIRKGPR